MKSIQMLVCVLLLIQTVWTATRRSTVTGTSSLSRCEPLKIKLCQNLNKYNKTVFPNFANDRSQWEAARNINYITPLLNSKCSSDLPYLACSYYAPVCDASYGMVWPCRSLCRRVKRKCAKTMKKLYPKDDWAKVWNCTALPKRRKNVVCVGRSSTRKNVKSLNLL